MNSDMWTATIIFIAMALVVAGNLLWRFRMIPWRFRSYKSQSSSQDNLEELVRFAQEEKRKDVRR